MLQDDWDILILHYLGLDHIGHLAGPSSSLVPHKLKEMDKVIQMLHESLQKWVCLDPKLCVCSSFAVCLFVNSFLKARTLIDNCVEIIQDKDHPDHPSYLVIVGDHGMHDLGSHGGATKGEVLASLILIENSSHMITPLE